uniref:Peptidase aspartic putative domain-containing protein n=1 Tax=Glossina austeni TaxID=7395 RepID=A0A1A9V1L2_GLOAU
MNQIPKPYSRSASRQSSKPMPNETQVQPSPKSSTTQPPKVESNVSKAVVTSAAADNSILHKNYVLLATARIRIIAANGNSAEFRAILDSGSQINLVSERLIRKLGASTSETSLHIDGIGNEMNHRRDFLRENKLNLKDLQRTTAKNLMQSCSKAAGTSCDS